MRARTPRSSAATFDLTSCRSMLRKLENEIRRARDAPSREDLADHFTNGAWTARHLLERVWADMKGNWSVKTTVAKEAGVPCGKFNRRAFERFVESQSQCPELAYCRLIADASKHVGAAVLPGDPNFEIEYSAGPSMTLSSLSAYRVLDWLPIYDDGRTMPGAFKIVERNDPDGEERTNAVRLLEHVRNYWVQFIDGHLIAID
jgi:hypothetical protein